MAGAYRVSKYGCAAEIAPSTATDEKVVPAPSPAEIVTRAGWVLNGQIARIVDRGYQKFLKTPKLEGADVDPYEEMRKKNDCTVM